MKNDGDEQEYRCQWSRPSRPRRRLHKPFSIEVRVEAVGMIYRRIEQKKSKVKTAEKDRGKNERVPVAETRYCGVERNQGQGQQKDESARPYQPRESKEKSKPKGLCSSQDNGAEGHDRQEAAQPELESRGIGHGIALLCTLLPKELIEIFSKIA